jgi:hypothetical protein
MRSADPSRLVRKVQVLKQPDGIHTRFRVYLPWRTNPPHHRGEDVGGSSAHAHVCSGAPEEHDSDTRLGWSDDRKFSGDHAWRPVFMFIPFNG